MVPSNPPLEIPPLGLDGCNLLMCLYQSTNCQLLDYPGKCLIIDDHCPKVEFPILVWIQHLSFNIYIKEVKIIFRSYWNCRTLEYDGLDLGLLLSVKTAMYRIGQDLPNGAFWLRFLIRLGGSPVDSW